MTHNVPNGHRCQAPNVPPRSDRMRKPGQWRFQWRDVITDRDRCDVARLFIGAVLTTSHATPLAQIVQVGFVSLYHSLYQGP